MAGIGSHHELRGPLYLEQITQDTNYLGEFLGTYTIVLRTSSAHMRDDPVPERRPAQVKIVGVPEDELGRYVAMDSASLDLQVHNAAVL